MITFKPLFGYMAYYNITAKDLMEKADLSQTAYTALKKGEFMSAKTLNKICQCLNLNIKDIMRYDVDVIQS